MGLAWPVHQTLITAFSFIIFVLTAIPLYWHLEAWNVGCVLYIFWVSLTSLIQFVNGVLWRDNAIIWPGSTVYCDITTRFSFAAGHGLLAASLVINRRLYKIATTTSVSITRASKRRAILVDLAIGLSIPIIHVVILWFYQGHRFNIFGGMGCLVAVPNTYLALAFNNVGALLIGLVSGFYSVGSIRAFMKRRKQFSELLSSNSNLTTNRYLRLMCLAGVELISTIPLTIFLIVFQAKQPIYKWKGLADMHLGFSRIEQYPAILWLPIPDMVTTLTLQPWLVIACGCVFFGFFGLAEEARSHYRMAFTTVAKKFGYTNATASSTGFSSGFPPSKGSKHGISITIPSFIQRSVIRRGSVSSFSDKLSTVGDLDDFKEKSFSPVGTSNGGSSSSISTPIDGLDMHAAAAQNDLFIARPDSLVIDVASPMYRPTPDVPTPIHPSPSDPSHMA